MSDVRKPRFPEGPARFGQSGWYDLPVAPRPNVGNIVVTLVWWGLILMAVGFAAATIFSQIW